MHGKPLTTLLAVIGAALLAGPAAEASLTRHYLERGRLRLSVDALGITGPAGQIQVVKPDGGTVVAAFLYAASQPNVMIADGDIELEGTPVAWADTIVSDSQAGELWHNYVADVTTIVQDAIASQTGRINLTIGELSAAADGTILAVVFEDPALPESAEFTVALLFGAQNVAGDAFNIELAEPIPDSLPPGYILDLSLGISFSSHFAPGAPQVSQVNVNGVRMTSSAGGEDDGLSVDGALITVGGVDDDNANPSDPQSATSPDDELYDLKPFVASGQTSISVLTWNPSNNDNILFAAFHTSGAVTIGEGLTLRPAHALRAIGSTHTIAGEMLTLVGSPVVGNPVTFSVFAGPHEGPLGAPLPTDEDGLVEVSFTGITAGTDSIWAVFTNSESVSDTSNVATVTWVEPVMRPISFPGTGSAPGIEDFVGYSFSLFSALDGGGIPVADLFGTLDPQQYRVGRWSPGGERYWEGGVDFSDLVVGRGYWIVTRDPLALDLQGFPGPSSDFSIRLESGPGDAAGWNQLGLPFDFPVNVADLRVTNGAVTRNIMDSSQDFVEQSVSVWTQEGGGTYDTGRVRLEPGDAFWVRKLATGAIDLIVPATPAAPRSLPSAPSQVMWTIGIRAREGARHTEQVVLGAADFERPGWNPLDASLPPLPDERITLLVPKTDWGRLNGSYLRVFEPEAPRMSWDVEIHGAHAPGEVALEFETWNLPLGARVWFTDHETGATREIVAPMDLRIAATSGSRRFAILADLEGSQDLERSPLRLGFLQAYPNPFTSAVGFRLYLGHEAELEVTIYDLAGRAVRTVGRRGAPGEHVLVWDGTNSSGKAVASGVYLVRYRVGEGSGTHRIVRIR